MVLTGQLCELLGTLESGPGTPVKAGSQLAEAQVKPLKRLTEPEVDELIRLYRQKVRIKDLAARFDIDPWTINEHLKRRNEPRRRQPKPRFD